MVNDNQHVRHDEQPTFSHTSHATKHPALPVIELRNVSKHYGSTLAVQAISFRVQSGELLALLGPSGCGKTSTLRLIAGLEVPDAGEIWLEGRRVAGGNSWVPPEARRVGMVFQDYALFPHLTVAENIAFPLKRFRDQARNKERVVEMLSLVGLKGLEKRYPHQLSGGQKQRVALARALAFEPAVVLLDEPFSNLDAALRKGMRDEVRRILRAAGATAIFVTHDQEEALSLADAVVVMGMGIIVQIGGPQEIYLRPATSAIATFVGEANLLPGWASGENVTCALGQLPLAAPLSGSVSVLIRPEQIVLEPGHTRSANRVEGVTFFGHDQLVQVHLDPNLSVQVRTWSQHHLRPGVTVSLSVQGPVIAYPTKERALT